MLGISAAGWLGIGTLAATAVGIGMQHSANKAAASNANALAQYNYAIEAQNIKQQQALAEWSAKANAGNAEAMARGYEWQGEQAAAAAEQNAKNLDQQGQASLTRGVEDVRRTREDQMRFSAIQRARQAKSGVAAAGTPIEVLAESARNMQLAINDSWYESNVEASNFSSAAEMERHEGRMAKAGLKVQAGGYRNQASLLRAEGALAPIKARQDMRRADLNRLAGLNQAGGMKSAATAGLVAGAGTLLSSGMSMYGDGIFGNSGSYGGYGGAGGSLSGGGYSIGKKVYI